MPADQETRKAFKVHGIVQGVGFRWWAQREGRRLGLRGTVRNCRDGTVEVAFAGTPDLVSEMERRLQDGPPAAHVIRLEELAPPEQLPAGFEISF
ncbi:MAG: acylphosphatase [Gemmatimonadota bacterium]|nr:MAG: acylphosphatase [Gemmatimonadota bacterium]